MVIDIQCSCCGNHESLENSIDATVEKIKSGWGSCGSALYCPKCSKEWKNRNGKRQILYRIPSDTGQREDQIHQNKSPYIYGIGNRPYPSP